MVLLKRPTSVLGALANHRSFAGFVPEGILHNFGGIAGTYNQEAGCAELSWIGHILARMIPSHFTGHMLTFIAVKPGQS
jgi:hypothetical protein